MTLPPIASGVNVDPWPTTCDARFPLPDAFDLLSQQERCRKRTPSPDYDAQWHVDAFAQTLELEHQEQGCRLRMLAECLGQRDELLEECGWLDRDQRHGFHVHGWDLPRTPKARQKPRERPNDGRGRTHGGEPSACARGPAAMLPRSQSCNFSQPQSAAEALPHRKRSKSLDDSFMALSMASHDVPCHKNVVQDSVAAAHDVGSAGDAKSPAPKDDIFDAESSAADSGTDDDRYSAGSSAMSNTSSSTS